MAATGGERVLTAELLVAVAVAWIGDVSKNKAAPTPSQMLGIVILYGVLSVVAMFGPQAARLAAGLGALVILTLLLKGGPQALTAVVGAAAGKASRAGSPAAAPATAPLPGGFGNTNTSSTGSGTGGLTRFGRAN